QGHHAGVEVHSCPTRRGWCDLECRVHPGDGQVAEALPQHPDVDVAGSIERFAAPGAIDEKREPRVSAPCPFVQPLGSGLEVRAGGAGIGKSERHARADAGFRANVDPPPWGVDPADRADEISRVGVEVRLSLRSEDGEYEWLHRTLA